MRLKYPYFKTICGEEKIKCHQQQAEAALGITHCEQTPRPHSETFLLHYLCNPFFHNAFQISLIVILRGISASFSYQGNEKFRCYFWPLFYIATPCPVSVPGTPRHSTDMALITSPGQVAGFLTWRKGIEKTRELRINEKASQNFSLSSQVWQKHYGGGKREKQKWQSMGFVTHSEYERWERKKRQKKGKN